MDYIRRTIFEDATRRDVLVCTGWNTELHPFNPMVSARMQVEMLQKITDEENNEVWAPYCRYHIHGKFDVPSAISNVHKFVNSAFQLVPAGTTGAVPEVLAIWGAMRQGMDPVLIVETLMDRMIANGNFDDLRQLT